MRQAFSIIGYLLLILFVLGIGYIALEKYIETFGYNELSSNTQDWANFATYISGTVGVAAVVATLIAFVITLSQQKRLIASQDKMLNEQKEQIRLTERQLQGEEDRRQIELAYNRALNIFPVLMDSFKNELNKDFVFMKNEEELYKSISSELRRMEVSACDIFFQAEVIEKSLEESSAEVVCDFIERLFVNVEDVYRFASENIIVSKDLKVYFDSYLLRCFYEDIRYYFYLLCYHAYLLGKNSKNHTELGVKALGFPEDGDDLNGNFKQWFDIGKMVNGVSED